MKNLALLLFTILLLAFASCTQTNEDKARSLIEDQLKKTMNDWNSYEFVEMTPLDSSFSVLSDNEEYYNLGLKQNQITLFQMLAPITGIWTCGQIVRNR